MKLLFSAYSQAITSFFYIAIVLVVYLEIKKNAQLEESWLGFLRNSINTHLYYVLLYGLIAGLVLSFLMFIFNITIDQNMVIIIWSLSFFLMLFNKRYLCLAYSIGIISFSSLFFKWPKTDVSSLILLVGMLHLVKSLLILVDGSRDSIPVHIEHKDLTPAGAYIMRKMWPIPLVTLLTPGQIVFPIVTALIYEDEGISQTPYKRARESSFWTCLYGLIISILAIVSFRVVWLQYVLAVATPILHELLIIWTRKSQLMKRPAFIAPWRGIRILEVLPEGIGHNMGLKQGDIILSINGKQLNSETMLDEILEGHPTFIWIMVMRDNEKEIELEYRD
ncbi:MAG TPA: PDZ domain-containing protein, partial [Clostridia bacterium]|nr:PDZ domain-containing protein [Clostridia bacterium]